MNSDERKDEGEVSHRRRENFYANLLYKVGKMVAQSQIYLNHAPRHERHALCQSIRVAQVELLNLVTSCRKYPRLDAVRDLDVKHEQLRQMWRLFYDLGYFAYRKNQKEENAENEAVRRFATMNVAINEIGGMIGGLVKAERRRLNELRKRKAEGKDV